MTETRIVHAKPGPVAQTLPGTEVGLHTTDMPGASDIRQVALNAESAQPSNDPQGVRVVGAGPAEPDSGGIRVVGAGSHKFRNGLIGLMTLAAGTVGLLYANRDKSAATPDGVGKTGDVSSAARPTPLNPQETREALQSLERSSGLLSTVSALLEITALQNASLKELSAKVFEAYKNGSMSDADFKKFRDLLHAGLPADKDNPWLNSGFSPDLARSFIKNTSNKALYPDGLDKTDEAQLKTLEDALRKLETHLNQRIVDVTQGSKPFAGTKPNVLGINFMGPYTQDQVNQGHFGAGDIARDLQLLGPALIVKVLPTNTDVVEVAKAASLKQGLANTILGDGLVAGILPLNGLSTTATDLLKSLIQAQCVKARMPVIPVTPPTASGGLGMYTNDGRELTSKGLTAPVTFVIFIKPDAFGSEAVHNAETNSKNVERNYPGTRLLYAVVADSREEAKAFVKESGHPDIDIVWVPSASSKLTKFPTFAAYDSHGVERKRATEPTGYNAWFMDTAAQITGK